MIKISFPSFALSLLLLFCMNSCGSQIEITPFPDAPFDHVLAYQMDEAYGKVIENNQLSEHVVGKPKELSKEQVESLLSTINSASSYGEVGASCFEPHLGFVFYNSSNEVVAHATVCLMCSWLQTSPKSCSNPLSRKGSMEISNLEKQLFN